MRLKTRQLVRSFIEEALYDPLYGYFSKNANIFHLSDPLKFNELADMDEYQSKLYNLYKQKSSNETFYQLWHTPSELFQPHFAHALAKYMLQECKHKDLIIYEVGPGNGTLCEGVSNYLKSHRVSFEYNLIEISEKLHLMQRERFREDPNVKCRRQSFMNIHSIDPRPCFVIAMEVWDNLAHDMISYSANGSLLQGMVEIDEEARYYEVPGRYKIVFEDAHDQKILKLVSILDSINYASKSLKWNPKEIYYKIIGHESGYRWQYIPTMTFSFIESFIKNFPHGRMIVSDFDYLPEPTPGHGSPVVQTRFLGDTVNCSTILLKKGLFDIFFPTDFGVLSKLFKKITNRDAQVVKHKDFLLKYANVHETRTKSGYNPMLEEFENVSFFLS